MILPNKALRYFYPPKPMRIYLDSEIMEEINNSPRWVAELKKNGWRCLIWKEDGKVYLFNRYGQRSAIMENASPELMMYFGMTLPDGTVIDGEYLDRRLQRKEYKGIYYAFDIMYYEGKSMMTFPFEYRRSILEKIIQPYEYLWIPQQIVHDKYKYYHEALKSPENEGIVIKKVNSPYGGGLESSKVVSYWLKLKKEGT